MPSSPDLKSAGRASLRIVLAEDSPLLRAGIVTVVETDGHVVCAATSTAEELIAATNTHQPDMIITDVRMPPTHTDEGIRAALKLRAARPELAVLILSQYITVASLDSLVAGNTGASQGGVGYLLKDRVAHVRHFLDTLRNIADGATVIDPDIIAALIGHSRQHGTLDQLSPREHEVLAHIAEGMTNGQIAERLVVSEAAIRKHVGNIFAKLPISSSGDRRVLAAITYHNSRR